MNKKWWAMFIISLGLWVYLPFGLGFALGNFIGIAVFVTFAMTLVFFALTMVDFLRNIAKIKSFKDVFSYFSSYFSISLNKNIDNKSRRTLIIVAIILFAPVGYYFYTNGFSIMGLMLVPFTIGVILGIGLLMKVFK